MFAAIISIATCYLTSQSDEKSFIAWMRSTNQIYTGNDYHFRFGIWLTNKKFVQEHNAKKSTFKLTLNKFAAMSKAEYEVLLGRGKEQLKPETIKYVQISRKSVPESIDYRDKKVVNEIKDQGECGSCWAFGTIQACESSYALKYGTLNVCSEQNLVDCAYKCSGCSGGYEFAALNYIISNQKGSLNSEKDYPYKAIETGDCLYDENKKINTIKDYTRGKEGDETFLRDMIGEKGVVDVAINAGQASFQLYKSGIYDDEGCEPYYLNHAVGCIGYGAENGVDYWIIRNSWGKSWGEEGYIRMIRNKGNQCGVASDAIHVEA